MFLGIRKKPESPDETQTGVEMELVIKAKCQLSICWLVCYYIGQNLSTLKQTLVCCLLCHEHYTRIRINHLVCQYI